MGGDGFLPVLGKIARFFFPVTTKTMAVANQNTWGWIYIFNLFRTLPQSETHNRENEFAVSCKWRQLKLVCGPRSLDAQRSLFMNQKTSWMNLRGTPVCWCNPPFSLDFIICGIWYPCGVLKLITCGYRGPTVHVLLHSDQSKPLQCVNPCG